MVPYLLTQDQSTATCIVRPCVSMSRSNKIDKFIPPSTCHWFNIISITNDSRCFLSSQTYIETKIKQGSNKQKANTATVSCDQISFTSLLNQLADTHDRHSLCCKWIQIVDMFSSRWTLTLWTHCRPLISFFAEWGESSLPLSAGLKGCFKWWWSVVSETATFSGTVQMFKCFPMDYTESCTSQSCIYSLTLYIQLYQQGITNSGTPSWNVRKWKRALVSKPPSWQDKLAP